MKITAENITAGYGGKAVVNGVSLAVESGEVLCLPAGLAEIAGVAVYGPSLATTRAAVVSFNIAGMEIDFVAAELEKRADIACRPGWQCAGLAHRTLGTERTGTVRLSPGAFTRLAEIETALEVIADLARCPRVG